jgi:hypothetical protein
MSVREIIFKNDDLTVVAFDCQTPTVFATFNEMGMAAHGDAYWGSRLFEDMGVSAVGFVSARPNWYPLSAMLPAIESVKERFPGRRMVTYGFSQGAYGALKFGKQLSSALTLAFSPQWSINPEDVAHADRRFLSYYDPLVRNGEQIRDYDLGRNCFVLFDRQMKPDAFNADRLLALGGVTTVPLAFAGHDTVRIVTEGGIGKSIIRLCLESDHVAARDIRALVRSGRRRSKTYAQAKVAQLENSAKRHTRFVMSAIDTLPAGAPRSIGRIRVLLSTGDYASAAHHLTAIADQELQDSDLLTLWSKFRSADFKVGEARLAPLFKRKYPDNVFARLHGVSSYVALAETDHVRSELEALAAMPGASVHTAQFVEYYQRIGRPDDAAAVAKTLGESGTVKPADRLRIGAGLLQLYKKYAMRPALFNELMAQARISAGNDEALLALIRLGMEIKSFSFVEHVIGDNPGLRDRYPVVQVYELECEWVRNRSKAAESLQGMFESAIPSYEYWTALSIACEKMLGVDQAIKAAVRSLRFAEGVSLVKTHARLVHLNTFGNHRATAIRHLEILRRLRPAPTSLYGGLAKLALQNDRPKLAVILANECLASETRDLTVRLQCCQVLIHARELQQAAVHVIAILARVEQELCITRSQLEDLLMCCQAVNFKLEQRVASVGTRIYPDDAKLHLLESRSRHFFGAKFVRADEVN